MPLNNTVKIENTEFVRDMDTKAVLSTDTNGLARYQESRKKALMARQETQETKKRLAIIEQDMAALKALLGELTVLRSRG